MKIKFSEKLDLIVDDFNTGEDFTQTFFADVPVGIDDVVDNTHGFKDIHFSHKIVAEGVDGNCFSIIK